MSYWAEAALYALVGGAGTYVVVTAAAKVVVRVWVRRR